MFWILIMAIMTAVVPGKARGACNDEEVLSLLKRHEIKVLLSADHTPAWVADFTRTSIDTPRCQDSCRLLLITSGARQGPNYGVV